MPKPNTNERANKHRPTPRKWWPQTLVKGAVQRVSLVSQALKDAAQVLGAGATSVIVPDWSDQTGGGRTFAKSWTAAEGIEDGLESSTWVYACVKKIAGAIGSLEWGVYYRDPVTGKQVELENHPLTTLIRQPSAWMTSQELNERECMHLDLAGNGMTLKQRDDFGQVICLWPINPDVLEPVIDPVTKLVVEYRVVDAYRSQSAVKSFPPGDIIHIRLTDPANLYWGLSPMRAAAACIETDVAAAEWNRNSMENRAVSDGILSFKRKLDDKAWTEATRNMEDQHMGASNARVPFVVGDDATFTPLTISPVDMDFINGRKMTREEICAIFGVPPQIVGIQDASTYNNMSEAYKSFWTNTVLPRADLMKRAWTDSLSPDFGGNLVIDYKTAGIQALSQVVIERVGTALTLFNMGVPFNAINDALFLNLPRISGGDVGFIPGGLTPLTEVEGDETDPLLAAAAGITGPTTGSE